MAEFPVSLGPVATLADIAVIEANQSLSGFGADTTYRLLNGAASRQPDRPAIIFVDSPDPSAAIREVSYGAFLDSVDRHASALKRSGLGQGATAAHLLPNLPETHFVVLGGQAWGAVVPVNWALEADLVASILVRCGAEILFCWSKPEYLNKARRVMALCPRLRELVVVGDGALQVGETAYADFLGRSHPDDAGMGLERVPSDRAALFLTGGTTSAPKLAQLSHRNISVQARVTAGLLDLGPDDRVGLGLPLFHVHGAIPNSLSPFAVGAAQVMLTPEGFRNRPLLDRFWQVISAHGVTVFNAVPTVYSVIAESASVASAATLRHCVCGSAALSTEVIRNFKENTGGIVIVEGYGLTEATCVSTLNPLKGDRRAGSIGLRVPFQELMIADADGNGAVRPCDVDTVGCVLVRGPNVFEGYLDPAANDGVLLADGWLNTGDLGRQDADGYVWLTGRAKDVIKRGGHSIDPLMIEGAVQAHPAVSLAAAVGMPDSHAGELPVVFVTLKPGLAVEPEDLRQFARSRVADRAAGPVELFILDEMPLTPVGKIFKPSLRKSAALLAARRSLERQGVVPHVEIQLDANQEATTLIVTGARNLDQQRSISSHLGWLNAQLVFPDDATES